jgi:hypothetical protein
MQWQNLIPLIDNALAGQDDYGEKGTLMIVGDLNNPFTAGVVERRSSLSNSVKTIIPSLILIRN